MGKEYGLPAGGRCSSRRWRSGGPDSPVVLRRQPRARAAVPRHEGSGGSEVLGGVRFLLGGGAVVSEGSNVLVSSFKSAKLLCS
jgi:hypothetical protein